MLSEIVHDAAIRVRAEETMEATYNANTSLRGGAPRGGRCHGMACRHRT